MVGEGLKLENKRITETLYDRKMSVNLQGLVYNGD